MANEKISAMSAALQPFTGSEKFPLVGSTGVNDSATFAALMFEMFNGGVSGVYLASLNVQDVANSTLTFDGTGTVILQNNAGAALEFNASGATYLNDAVGSGLQLDGAGNILIVSSTGAGISMDNTGDIQLSGSDGLSISTDTFNAQSRFVSLSDRSGCNLTLFNTVTLVDSANQGFEISSGIVAFDNYPTFSPGSFSGTVTTASLVGKTLTFTNGLLTSFA